MSTDLAFVLVLLAAAIVMFAINRPRMDAVALIMLTVLPFTGVISVGEALAGKSPLLSLVDEHGRKLLVPADRLAYVEIGEPAPRRVGFGTL